MSSQFREVDPRVLRLPASRRNGADPVKLGWWIAQLAPGTLVRVEVIGRLRRAYESESLIGDLLS